MINLYRGAAAFALLTSLALPAVAQTMTPPAAATAPAAPATTTPEAAQPAPSDQMATAPEAKATTPKVHAHHVHKAHHKKTVTPKTDGTAMTAPADTTTK